MNGRIKKIFSILLVSTLLAGCTDGLPSPDDVFGEETVEKEWVTQTGNYTILIDDSNNSTYTSVVIGEDDKWLEVTSFSFNATHLSFDIVNNTVIFNNKTFNVPSGYLYQTITTTEIVEYTYPIYTLNSTTSNMSYTLTGSMNTHIHNASNLAVINLTTPLSLDNITIETGEYNLEVTNEIRTASLDVEHMILFGVGMPPSLGTGTLFFPMFDMDITVEYTVTYRLWDGRE